MKNMDDEPKTGDVVLNPIIEKLSFLENAMDKNLIIDGESQTIELVKKVKTPKYGDRYIIRTNKGETFLNWTSVKALTKAFGDNTINWKGMGVKITKTKMMVEKELRTVLYFDKV